MHRLFHVFSKPDRRKETVVVVWGVHSPDWMTALAASAPVWKRMPTIRVVLNHSLSGQVVPLKARWGRRTVVIPLMEPHITERPQRYAALVPTSEALAILSDKARFADYVDQHALGHLCPTTYESIEDASFPCVIKRTDLNGGHGVEVAASLEAARQLLGSEPFAGHPCIFQKVVPFTVEYAVHCVCLQGRIVWHTVYAFEFEKHHIRKAGCPHCTFRRATIPARILRDLEAFLLPLAYSGPCNVDCTWDAEGRLMVFEINPRMGGSLMRRHNTADLAACLEVIVAEATSA